MCGQAPNHGTVVQILATTGQQVKAGQVILVLDNVQQSAALDAARSETRKDILNAERYDYLYGRVPSQRRRGSLCERGGAGPGQARSDAAELGYKFKRAPINGVVGDQFMKLGDYVGKAITGIVDNSILWTLMEIPASDASAVKVGQTVKLVSGHTTGDRGGQGELRVAVLRGERQQRRTP